MYAERGFLGASLSFFRLFLGLSSLVVLSAPVASAREVEAGRAELVWSERSREAEPTFVC